MVTNGCCVPLARTAFRSPAQKMTVTPATNPIAAFTKYETTKDHGIVYEASFAFSAA